VLTIDVSPFLRLVSLQLLQQHRPLFVGHVDDVRRELEHDVMSYREHGSLCTLRRLRFVQGEERMRLLSDQQSLHERHGERAIRGTMPGSMVVRLERHLPSVRADLLLLRVPRRPAVRVLRRGWIVCRQPELWLPARRNQEHPPWMRGDVRRS
jgi:hypothetical protein